MKRYIFILLFMVAQTVAAQTINNEFYIRGHVIDNTTKEHIPYATASIVGTTIGVAADETGHFFLRGVPAGEHTLRISTVGYSAIDQEIVVTNKSDEMNLTFNLKPDVMSLDQVVVTANRTEVKRRNSPSVVSVIPTELFSNVGAPTLVDGLSYQPGVRVENNCQNCGFTQVRINGLEGSYSQILIDSRPMFSALTGVYGLEHIPANMIERVEVVRGGGSALFGSSAIGGTINVITKTPEYNSAEFANNFTVLQGGSIDNNTTANISMISDNQRAGVTLFGQVRNRQSYDANDDGYTEIPELKSSTLGARAYFKTGDYSKLSLQYDYSSEDRRGGSDLELAPHDSAITEMVEHKINGGGANYDLFSRNYKRKLNLYVSGQSTIRDSFYGTFDVPNSYSTTTEALVVAGAQFTQSWDKLLFMPSEFVAGVEYNYSNLLDVALKSENTGNITDPDDIIGFDQIDPNVDQRVNTTSAYLQNEWRNDKFGILLGVRADKNSLLDHTVFSPRINLRYNPSENVNFRATYATGFRAPQVFDEDLHIAVVNGDRTVILLADDLSEEKSQSVSVSADLYKNFGKVSTNLLVEGFYTILNDAFAVNEETGLTNENGDDVWIRHNSGGAIVKGISVEARATLPNIVSAQASMTYQSSRYKEAEEWSEGQFEDKFFRTPDLYGYLTANFDVTRKLMISASGTYTGSMLIQKFSLDAAGNDVAEAIDTPSFFDANLKASYSFGIAGSGRMELSAGVLNIFNSYQDDFQSGFDRDPGYMYGPMNPRRFTLGAKLLF